MHLQCVTSGTLTIPERIVVQRQRESVWVSATSPGQYTAPSRTGVFGALGVIATSINACDVLPFHPNMDKSISFDAIR